MPFHCIRDVKLEQPILGANYLQVCYTPEVQKHVEHRLDKNAVLKGIGLQGIVLAQPGGNWEGDGTFKMSFGKGGCIDFGQGLLKAVHMGASAACHSCVHAQTRCASFSGNVSNVCSAATVRATYWRFLQV